MSKCLLKTILSPALIMLMLFTAMFTAAAETSDQFDKSNQSLSNNKRNISTSDEKGTSSVEANTIPTMKPAHYYPVNSQEYDQSNKTSDNTNTPDNISSNNIDSSDDKSPATATPEIGATSQVSTSDTLYSTSDIARSDIAASGGVVNTGNTSVSIFVLLGLIASSCLLIGIHKKEITE